MLLKPKTAIDRPIPRPTNRGEAIRHVKAVYGEQKWKEPEQAVNAEMIGLEFKAVQFFSNGGIENHSR